MAMNYEKASRGIPQAEAEKYATGIGLINDSARSLKRKNLLPDAFSEAKAPVIKISKSAFEIPTVSEEQYTETREALEKLGFNFVVTLNPQSIDQLANAPTTAPLFGYINPSDKMRSNLPPQMEIAIDPNHFRIEGSNNLSTTDQFKKIKEQEVILKEKLPENIRNVISMLRPKHASILAQLDFEHQKRTRRVLFTNWFGRTDDQTVPGFVAIVGRYVPASRLDVFGWNRFYGNILVFAVSTVVLPQKLAV